MTKEQKKILQHVVILLKQKFSKDWSGHDWLHMERVWKMAKKLAKGERINYFILEMAALLHDVDDYKFKKNDDKEFSQTKSIFHKVGVKDVDQMHILKIIKNISYKGAGVPTMQKTIEGKIVQDADRLDAMGAIGVARVFAYGGSVGHPYHDPSIKPQFHTSFIDYKKHKKTTINHFYEKLLLLKDRMNTTQAKKMAMHRHKFLEAYLREFFAEVEGRV